MESFHSHRNFNALKSSGFTLVELLVVFTIITVVMTIVFTSQSSFNKTLILSNTAYDIALTMQSTKTYGLGSRAVAGGITNAGYGLHFDKSTPGMFTLFADIYPATGSVSGCHPVADWTAPNARPGNCTYDPANSERVLDYTLGNGVSISDICAYYGYGLGGSKTCVAADEGGGRVTSLDVIFARPNADPFMSVNGRYSPTNPVIGACITLTSPQGGLRFIEVNSAGAVTANSPACP